MTQPSLDTIYRVLDAALNRASEGLRVVEDYLRMGLNDRALAGRAKRLRHALTTAAGGLDSARLILTRDSQYDVGRSIQTDTEFQRQDESDLVPANLARTQQSLRALEEYGKLVSTELAKSVEQLRFEVYTLEKAILTTTLSIRNLAQTRLYVLVERGNSIDTFVARVQSLIDGGVDLIQLRDKRLSDRDLLEAGVRLTELTRGTRTRWIMNDRADLALAAGADGVHVGQDDLPVAEVRRVVGANRLVGVSTHSLEQARQAVWDGANYIGVGPTFPSSTKSFDQIPGLELLEQVAQEIQLPAFAIGGITLEHLSRVLETGIHRVAVQHAIAAVDDPTEAIQAMKGQLKGRT